MSKLISGKLHGSHLYEALPFLKDILQESGVVIVRSIDSACVRDDLTRILSLHKISYDVVKGNVCIPVSSLWRALDCGLFNGFDEVWFYDGLLPGIDLNRVSPATSDAFDFSQGIPDDMFEAVETTNCILVLADGCGLNYATRCESIRKRLASLPGSGI